MCDIEKQYYQYANIDYIKNKYGTEKMVQVAGKANINNSSASFWCCLLPVENVEDSLKNYYWDSSIGVQCPGFVKNGDRVIYKRSDLEYNKCENIVNYRDFYGIKKGYFEICEEFILLNNLFYDINNNRYLCILDNGKSETVAIIDDDKVCINLNYLIRYASAKQMALALFFDFRYEFRGRLEEYNLDIINNNMHIYNDTVYGLFGGCISGKDSKIYSVLQGKKIFPIMPVETCGYWPYEKKRKYYDYIIGIDEYGESKMYTSDPNKLTNPFDIKSDGISYFTPVFFNKEVLLRYIENNNIYRIENGYIKCGNLWEISIDEYHEECVSVYLGDLGTYLPEEEQMHWKMYNIALDKGISEVAYCRDFLCMFMEQTLIDHKFKYDFMHFQEDWKRKYEWMLLLPLADSDSYNFEQIHSLIVNNQKEFDFLVLNLVKVLIDSLNVKELDKRIEVEPNMKSIAKLKKWFNISNISGYEEHINFLKDLQCLRSSSVGHRKGKNYEDIKKKFNIIDDNYKEVFDEIIKKSDNFILFLRDNFLQGSD